MVTETLRSMLGRLNRSEDMDRLPAKLAALINTYDNAEEIHPQFRLDMFKMIEAAIEMASLMAESEYDAIVVQRQGFQILGLVPTFIQIAEKSQLSRTAYAIQNKASRVTLPNIYNSEEEAKLALKGLAAMMDVALIEIIPIKVSLASGAPPKAPQLSSPNAGGASPIPHTTPPPMPSADPGPNQPPFQPVDKAPGETELVTKNPEKPN
jgi:hypothetical protein